MEAEAWSSREPMLPHFSLCSDSCKGEVTHVSIYLITTCGLFRALSSLWGRHDLHYNDTVDIFPVTLIVTSLLPVGICGFIRRLVQAIWSCDETRQEGGGWGLRRRGGKKKKKGFSEYQSTLSIYQSNLMFSPVHLSCCLWICEHPLLQKAGFLQLAVSTAAAVVRGAPSTRSLASWASRPDREEMWGPCFALWWEMRQAVVLLGK